VFIAAGALGHGTTYWAAAGSAWPWQHWLSRQWSRWMDVPFLRQLVRARRGFCFGIIVGILGTMCAHDGIIVGIITHHGTMRAHDMDHRWYSCVWLPCSSLLRGQKKNPRMCRKKVFFASTVTSSILRFAGLVFEGVS
jgi:hypothetical protein